MSNATSDGLSPSSLGIAHRVEAHAQSGSLAVSVPIEVTAGRGGFGPQLSLDYLSSASNGAYGRGWSLSGLLTISVNTARGLPRYDGADTFVFSGSGELVPHADAGGDVWEDRGAFRVRRYRARFERSFLRIESWHEKATGRIHWRARDARNTITIFGERGDQTSRIFDPEHPEQVHTWLPDIQIDSRGNAIVFHYAPETFVGVNSGRPEEAGRTRFGVAPAYRYLKRIEWGNLEPLSLANLAPAGQRWCFQLVFDYGDHDPADPAPAADRAWPVRPDAFSSYAAGFEVRQYRLCRRMLLFHDFPELAAGPVCVQSFELDHEPQPEGCRLLRVHSIGYRSDGGARSSKERPPLVFEYTTPRPGRAFLAAPAFSLDHIQHGLDGPRYRLIDLYGEGLPGILIEHPDAWSYKPNLGGGRFGQEKLVLERPSHGIAQVAVQDFDGDGNTDLVVHGSRTAGYYQFDRETQSWRSFIPFPSVPHLDSDLATGQILDVDGDGLSDLVLGGPDRLTWYPSLGKGGYAEGQSVQPLAASATRDNVAPWRDSPRLYYFFADMTGDGLLDQVLVRDGSVVYWPNRGYGRFAAPVTMDGAPRFSGDGQFDPGRLLFADLDGSGTSDFVYVGNGEVTTWINAGGNALLPERSIRGLPLIDRTATLRIFDFLGDGTPCLVWSQTTGSGAASLQYLPLTDGVKPGLLTTVSNSLGAERRITYATSASHYLRDAGQGRDWRRKLPHHVVVVDAVELIDHIGGARSQLRYRYHDGSYDGRERRFRGFGFVEVFDVDVQSDAGDDSGLTAPACTRSWYHLGAEGISSHDLMWAGDPNAMSVAPHMFEAPDALTQVEADDALMALAGQAVRHEVFAVRPDGAVGDTPFSVEQTGYLVRRLQPAWRKHLASFAIFERERLSSTYEQIANDPRIQHHLTLEIDNFGSAVTVCDVAYPRRLAIPAADPAQRRSDITVNRLVLSHVDLADQVELATLVESEEFDIAGLDAPPGETFQWRSFKATVIAALADPVAFDAAAVAPGAARRVNWSRHYYWNGPGTDVLALGQSATPIRMHHVESAAFTPTLADSLYDGKIDAARLMNAGYRLADGYWWQTGEVFVYGDAPVFFRMDEIRRQDGGTTAFAYDAANLKAVRNTDALGSGTQVELDYHLLAPRRSVDENGCVSEVLYDPLGVAIATTMRGEVPGAGGSRPYGFELLAGFAWPAGATPEAAIADPDLYIGDVASVMVYDVDRWAKQGRPPLIVMLTRENLRHDGSGVPLPPGAVGVTLTYFDGFGRGMQTKLKVEAGDAVKRNVNGAIELGPDGHPLLAPAADRWLVQGHTVYNRKQQPVFRYEPFFSSRSEFEDEQELRKFGVAHAFVYDAIGRPIRHDEPNGTFSRAEHEPWLSRTFDTNDTVEQSLYRIPRMAMAATAPERRAYENAKAHSDTPVVTHFDPLGRTILLAESGSFGQVRRTVSRYGVDRNLAEVIDPRGFTALTQAYDMLGRVARAVSLDSGEDQVFYDCFGRPVDAWNTRGLHVERGFDLLDRLVSTDISGALDGAPIARRRVQSIVYGEDATVVDAKARNLLGRAAILRDDAGERTIETCAPAGLVLASVQRVIADVEVEPDWSNPGTVLLLPDIYRTRSVVDGMGRITRQDLPDGSTQLLRYARNGGLRDLNLSTDDGLIQNVAMLQAAEFNARGQRVYARLGNGVEIVQDFDNETWRTRNLRARRLGGPNPGVLMDIAYTYDPVGNVVMSLDKAQQPSTALPVFRGLSVSAEKVFGYDAFYQIVRAEGRVHQALLPDDNRTDAPNANTIKGARRLSFNDMGQLERYVQTYSYDLSGNMTKLVHSGVTANWTTDFWVSGAGNRSLPALDVNGLPLTAPESQFDAAGNCLRFPYLRALQWSYHNRLRKTVIIDRSAGGKPDDAEWYVSDSDGRRVRKQTRRLVGGGAVETTDIIYLDGCEVKRITRNGVPVLERKLIHVSDGINRVAQVYRWSRDDSAREVSNVAATKVRYQVNDHLGSAHLALDEKAEVIAYEEYLPFGGTAFIGGDDIREVELRSYRFAGKERDDATGLSYFGHRYYAPWLGRWISPDPGGFVDGLNRYVYVHNNPTTYFDPEGLESRQKQGQEKVVYGAVPLEVLNQWANLPAERREALKKLQKDGNFAWFYDAGTGRVHFGSRFEIGELARAKLRAGENVGRLQSAPKGAKPGDAKGTGGGKQAPKASPRKEAGEESAGVGHAAEKSDGGKKPGAGSSAGDPGQGQDGSQGAAKGAGDKPGDGTGKDDSHDPGGQSATPGDGGGDGSVPGSGGIGGTGPGKGEKGTGTGGGGTGDEVGTGSGSAPGMGSGSGTGHGEGEGGGDKDAGSGNGGGNDGTGEHGSGTGGDHDEGVPGGKGTTPGGDGHGKEPGGHGMQPGGTGGVDGGLPNGQAGGATQSGTDPNGQPNGNAPGTGNTGSGQTTTGDPNGKRNDGAQGSGGGTAPNPNTNDKGSAQGKPGGQGQPGGNPGSGKGGEPAGPPQKKTVMDYVSQVAGYWNLEFGGGDAKGASGGIPGGFGTHNWGGWGQAIYVALTIADIVVTFLSLGGTAGIKASLKAGWAATKKLATSVGRKTAAMGARLLSREFWSHAISRGVRAGINWNPFKSRSLGEFLTFGKIGRVSTSAPVKGVSKAVDFLELEAANGGRIFASTDIITHGHVDDLANQLLHGPLNQGKTIEIITGRHGDRAGFDFLQKELQFLFEDYGVAPAAKNVVIHNAMEMSPAKMQAVLESGNDVILGWCFSENSRQVIKALGLNFMRAPF
ncbi:SpvB/TcaC N-terminal domain-containing protein [Paraburkholderia terrae]|uniref:SpvB/TcaC N-terminal domain-containing protein n=1 Tax=Paraburkholderia terrae TaxID=311230 RepID=UPI00206FA2A9|nr:SpvB/TcaC N-terminal domain-containing protein [Paraburkholderia terrae]BDC46005.1 hypothetical protein PTKU15_93020 [Paraburkholderia terrae]